MCVCFRMECQINLRRNCFGPKRKYKKENAISEAGIARDIELRSLMTFFQPFMSLLSRRKKRRLVLEVEAKRKRNCPIAVTLFLIWHHCYLST